MIECSYCPDSPSSYVFNFFFAFFMTRKMRERMEKIIIQPLIYNDELWDGWSGRFHPSYFSESTPSFRCVFNFFSIARRENLPELPSNELFPYGCWWCAFPNSFHTWTNAISIIELKEGSERKMEKNYEKLN